MNHLPRRLERLITGQEGEGWGVSIKTLERQGIRHRVRILFDKIEQEVAPHV